MTVLTADAVAADEREPVMRRAAERLAAAAGVAWSTVDEALGVFEWIVALGAVMLLAGLWLWFGAGPALTVVGGIVLVLGVAGGRAAAALALAQARDDAGEV